MKTLEPSGITKANLMLGRPRATSAAAREGRKSWRSIASRTRRAVSARTPLRPCRTRSSVARLTPASRAISFNVR